LARRRPDRRRVLVAASTAALVVLAGCSTRSQAEVGTTIVGPTGSCDTSRVVEIGATLPLSGSSGALGREYLEGLRLAVTHVNHSGGVLGSNRCLELAYKDDRGDPQLARRAVSDLVNHETVTFLVGPSLPSQVHAAGTSLARPGIPTGGLSSLDVTFRPARFPWMFPLSASNQTVAGAMAGYASSQGWSRVAVAAEPGAAGTELVRAFTAAAGRRRITIAGPVVHPTRGDEAAQLARLRTSNPQGLVLLDTTPAVSRTLLARAQLPWSIPVVATPIATDATVVQAVGRPALDGVAAVVPQPLVQQPGISNASARHFRDDLRRQLRTARLDGSVLVAAQAYDAVMMLASTANSVHSTSPTSLRTFLESASYTGLLASYAYSTGSHTGIPGDQLSIVPVNSLSDGLF
jgi:branched-chain amino acid transport system substrate-binding protein